MLSLPLSWWSGRSAHACCRKGPIFNLLTLPSICLTLTRRGLAKRSAPDGQTSPDEVVEQELLSFRR